MIRLILYVVLTNACLVSYSQKKTIEQEAKFITGFSFRQLSGGVILLQAKFNNIPQPLNFILDTGSGGISLDSATTEEFKIPHVPSGRTVNGIAGIRQVDVAKDNRLTFPNLIVDSLDFYINDYEILSSVYGEKIDGIIGYSLISRYIIKLDFDSLRIEFFTKGEIRYPRSGFLLHPLFTALPIQPLIIKDARQINANFYIDTGAGLCFLISKQFEEDSSALGKQRKPVSVEVQGLGGKKEMLLTIIKEVRIGPYRFRKVPTNILDDEFNATSYPFIGGVIGNDLLRRFNIVLNYQKKEIHLLPNKHFREEFDYSYTGMNMYYIDGVVMVEDVVEGSPADKGGLKEGDIILGINSNFSNNVSTYRNLMQHVGEKITILATRNNEPLILKIRIGRIF